LIDYSPKKSVWSSEQKPNLRNSLESLNNDISPKNGISDTSATSDSTLSGSSMIFEYNTGRILSLSEMLESQKFD
jgi:hypothetical protein